MAWSAGDAHYFFTHEAVNEGRFTNVWVATTANSENAIFVTLMFGKRCIQVFNINLLSLRLRVINRVLLQILLNLFMPTRKIYCKK